MEERSPGLLRSRGPRSGAARGRECQPPVLLARCTAEVALCRASAVTVLRRSGNHYGRWRPVADPPRHAALDLSSAVSMGQSSVTLLVNADERTSSAWGM